MIKSLKKIHASLISASSDFHVYNCILPAFLPIISVFILLFTTWRNNTSWLEFFLGSISQLIYFSFFIMVSNVILLIKKDQDKTKSLHLILSIVVLIIYLAFSVKFYVNKSSIGVLEGSAWAIGTTILLYLAMGIYATNPDAPYAEDESIITTYSIEKTEGEKTTDEELND